MARIESSQNAKDVTNISDDDLVYLSDTDVAKKEAVKEVAAGDSTTKEGPGMRPEVKDLYPGKRNEDGTFSTYTDKCLDELPKPVENEDTARFALVVRNKICPHRERGLARFSIQIQSPLLKKVLCRVLEDYPGIAPGLDFVEFMAPFRPFVHRWQRLTDALNNERDTETKSHIQVLHDILQEELKLCLETRADWIHHKLISFNDLWLIFEPGTTIVTTRAKRQIAAKLKHTALSVGKHEDVFNLESESIYFDGETFGWDPLCYEISEFAGVMKIDELPVCPLDYHPEVTKIKKRLIANGRKFEQLAGLHHKAYKGVALHSHQPYYVDSRIIIDAKTYNRHNPGEDRGLRPLARSRATSGYDSSTSLESHNSQGRDDGNHDDDDEEGDAMTQSIPALTEEQLLLCGYCVRGYSLRNKRWLNFFVDTIEDIKWKRNTCWRDVVMDREQKSLIHSVIKGHLQGRKDLHSRGLNIALSGRTGVGKTFLVESLAEHLQAPLFQVEAADLDVDSRDPGLESPFTDVLEMCSDWNAIILYDNAQRLLHRSDDDASYSKADPPTQVVLNGLENHSAAFFITSILPIEQCISPRLRSRLHLRLYLPFPTPAMRSKIWQNCIRAEKDFKITDFDYDDAARWPMNGHEIVNAVRGAKAMMKHGHLEAAQMKHIAAFANPFDCLQEPNGQLAEGDTINSRRDYRGRTHINADMHQDEDDGSTISSWAPPSKAKQFDPFQDDTFPQAKIDTRQRTLNRLGKASRSREEPVDYIDNDYSWADKLTNSQSAVASNVEEEVSDPFPESKPLYRNFSDYSDSTFFDEKKKKTKKGKQASATTPEPPCEPVPDTDAQFDSSSFQTRTKKKGKKAATAKHNSSPPAIPSPKFDDFWEDKNQKAKKVEMDDSDSLAASPYLPASDPPLLMNCKKCPSLGLIEEGRYCTFCGSRAQRPKSCRSCSDACGTSPRGRSGRCGYCGKKLEDVNVYE
ncbi:MAG: hypothetical protein Q9174_003152 [Haloplaca sp. 1 TL-2023]